MSTKPAQSSASHGPTVSARLCVLASGSGGNLSILQLGRGAQSDYCLIDLGVAPRTALPQMLAMGIKPSQIRAAFVTHLDGDHFKRSWQRALPNGCRIFMHMSHARSAASRKLLTRAITPFHARSNEHIDVMPDLSVQVTLASHDELGVSSFRFDFLGGRSQSASLGYATDLGRVPDDVVETLQDVDVMAIESNYCPIMQRASDRPDFLKRRIMGGAGHLSNEQSREALENISPRASAVLLHLSRDCNTPERAHDIHTQSSPQHTVVVSTQTQPTPWIDIAGSAKNKEVPLVGTVQQMPLFHT